MNNFIYKIDHDFGLAPNPFGGFCTLAVCKSDIRKCKNLEIGSWIFGIASKKLKTHFKKLIYCMRVEDKISFSQYWEDPRFQFKKVVKNGSIAQLYGDNIYHYDLQSDKWIQEDSAHSNENGVPNEEHSERDLDGKYVLISEDFYYFGRNSIDIPEDFSETIYTKARDFQYSKNNEKVDEFVQWLKDNYKRGIIYGDPINWIKEYGE